MQWCSTGCHNEAHSLWRQCLKTFLIVKTEGRGCYWHLWDASNHSTKHKTALHNEKLSSPEVLLVLRLRNSSLVIVSTFFKKNYSIVDIQYYISFWHTTYWFHIYIHYKLVTMISLVTIGPHTKLLQYLLYSLCYALHYHDLFHNWNFCTS